ncbi:hypothetical protein LAZ67_16002345 [Cordylochernes scorpioides]|uniref:DDE-1 domain-containing protein n=1 Tax=Cordylochernes scorpioides TaxID=51811 RepID=A0ABY6LEJ3_9ARAC|nr:hypothetical protein LAZ67_16002345 [Cordylochernes scorpioides]
MEFINYLLIQNSMICESYIKYEGVLKSKFSNYAISDPSGGWLSRYRARHNLKNKKVVGEALSADEDAANRFKDDFHKLMTDEKYEQFQIYNADETGVYWKSLPDNSQVKNANSASGHKQSKDRLSVLLCANADASHKNVLAVVGKSKRPRQSKTSLIDCLSITIYLETAGDALQLSEDESDEDEQEIRRLEQLFQRARIEVNQESINEWIDIDLDDPGHNVLSNDDIVEAVLSEKMEIISSDDSSSTSEDSLEPDVPRCEALKSLDVALKYLENRTEPEMLASYNTINSLRTMLMREEEALLNKPKKQTTISNFFAKP